MNNSMIEIKIEKAVLSVVLVLVLGIHCLDAQEFDHNFGPGINKPFVESLDYTTPVGLEFDEFNRPYVMSNVLSPDKTSDDIYRDWTLRNGR